ncbi:MAG: hypothetical protein A2817_02355 [Candidatus Yanofskybacteria bacterium RIFCSPHIGHO2_01_FULL_39_8b]|uniref:Rieske domain-containing protein n=1 Tax=Candidatus Yanofskybacteria bacterium RIFCSPHIGHO2_01_FULL_39_8b TaxID=1802659 RepID=A0A1F8EF98_9BACT|nr:MAG: hypothetical protein A2817_02355 [Candidatus Yanofskybacteria bacterium RIFCSPHIGHO2_01_FULL_39_8b]
MDSKYYVSGPVGPKPVPDGMSRRSFFSAMTIILGGVISSVLGFNLGRYFISPVWATKKENWINISLLEKIPNGIPTSVNYIQRKPDGWMANEGVDTVWFLRQGNKVIAFNPKCTHLGCPYRWDSEKDVFVCPCHTALFSKTGEVLSGPPPRPLDRYPVKTENGIVKILPEPEEGEI